MRAAGGGWRAAGGTGTLAWCLIGAARAGWQLVPNAVLHGTASWVKARARVQRSRGSARASSSSSTTAHQLWLVMIASVQNQ